MNNSVKKILITIDSCSGSWLDVVRLVQTLTSRGLEAIVVTYGRFLNTNQRRQLYSLNGVEVLETDYDPVCQRDISEAGKFLVEVERKYKPDVVHLEGFLTAAEVDFSAPCIVSANEDAVRSFRSLVEADPEYSSFFTTLFSRRINNKKYILGPSKAVIDQVLGADSCLANAFILKPQGASYLTTKENFIFTHLTDRDENRENIARMCGSLSWPVLISSKNDNCFNEAYRRQNNVFWLGKLNETEAEEYASKAAIFFDGAVNRSPNLLTAALSGSALVLDHGHGEAPLWDNHCQMVHSTNGEEVIEKLDELITNDEKRQQLSSMALEKAQQLIVSKRATRFLQLYETVLS